MRIVVENGTLIDGTGADPLERAGLVIDDGRIVAVGALDSIDRSSDGRTRVVDATGRTITPGLFDMHVHSTFRVQRNVRNQVAEVMRDPDHVLFSRAMVNVQTALRAGITSVRDLGGRGAIAVWLRDTIDQGLVHGPRMFVSGQPVTTTAGHLNWLGQTADSIDEIRAAVRRQVANGVDLIKVCSTGGAMTPGSNRGRAQYTAEELTALVQDAHRLRKTVASHTLCTEGMRNSVAAGCDTIEHCYWYDDRETEQDLEPAVAESLVAQGLYVSPVIGAGDQAGYLAHQCPENVRDRWRDPTADGEDHFEWMGREMGRYLHDPGNQRHFANFRHLRAAGARFVAGTDAGAGATRFQDLWACLGMFVHSLGFTPVEAIQSATRTCAEALNVGKELGTLEVGKLADVIIVQGNPATDGIQCLQKVDLVIKNGRVVAEHGQLIDQAGL